MKGLQVAEINETEDQWITLSKVIKLQRAVMKGERLREIMVQLSSTNYTQTTL